MDDVQGLLYTVRIPTTQDTLDIAVEAAVAYVEKSGSTYVTASDPTWFKEVTLTLQGPMGSAATLSRIYTYLPE